MIGVQPSPNKSPTRSQLVDLSRFLRSVARAIIAAPPLVPEPTLEFPEDFVNEEHARMAEAVAAILDQSAQRNEILSAWVE